MKFHGIIRLKDGTKLKITAEDTEAYPIKTVEEAYQALLPKAKTALVLSTGV